MGLYNATLPDLQVQDYAERYFQGSRVRVSADCSAAAVTYNAALISLQPPPHPSGTLFRMMGSTFWYSGGTKEDAMSVIASAEQSISQGMILTKDF